MLSRIFETNNLSHSHQLQSARDFGLESNRKILSHLGSVAREEGRVEKFNWRGETIGLLEDADEQG